MMAATQDPNNLLANWRCFFACFFVVLAPFQYGLDFGIMSGFQAMPGFLKIYGYEAPETALGWNLSTVRQQLITSLMTLGAFIGSNMIGFMAMKLGRIPCLWIATVLCCIANTVMMCTTGIGELYFGRLFIGISNGFFMTFSQLYIQETGPAKYRGFLVSSYQFFIALGTLVGSVVDWATAKRLDRSSYLIPLGVVYVTPVLMSIGLIFMPESPRWLILRGRVDEARKGLRWLRPEGHDVEKEVTEISDAIERERQLAHGAVVWESLRNPIDRRRTFISLASMATHSASGAMYLMGYKAYFFAMADIGLDPFAMSNVIGACGLVSIIINALLIVRYGRRRVWLIGGLVSCGILQIIMAVVYDTRPGLFSTGKVIVALSSVQIAVYQGMVAPTAWLTSGEIPTQRLRTFTYGQAASLGYILSWLVAFTAPYFINPRALNWGPKYGYIWFPSCIVAAVWMYFFLPEVNGRTLEEIDYLFLQELPARQFRKQVIPQNHHEKMVDDDGKKADSVDVEELK